MAIVIRRLTRKDGKAKGTLRKSNIFEAIKNGSGNIIFSQSDLELPKKVR